jgi:hypothetical protein
MRHYKITAGNNAILARIKAAFNGKVYQQALAKMNDPKGGVEAVREYVRRFFNEEFKHRADELIDGTCG